MNNFSNIPLQDLIAGVIKTAEDKIEEDNDKAKKMSKLFGESKEEKKEESGREKATSLTDPDYIEKLASAVEFIIEKKAGLAVPPAVPAGDLPVEKSLSGPPPPHKPTKPAGGKDAANASGEGFTDGGLASTTQVANDYNDVPGGPKGYPEKGVLVNGPKVTKTASVRDLYIEAISKKAMHEGMPHMEEKKEDKKEDKKEEKEKTASISEVYQNALLVKESGVASGASKAGKAALDWLKAPAKTYSQTRAGKWGPGQGVLKSLGHTVSKHKGQAAAAGLVGAGVAGGVGGAMSSKDKKAEDLKQLILSKLAGEDVFPSNISAPKDASPLVGGGELKVDDATQPRPTDSGYGNEGRSHVQTSDAAIKYTKGTAKAPQKKQLKEVLDEPALSRKTDPVLHDSWQNADKAGVKIAMENAKALLLKVAEEGTPEQKERLQQVFTKKGQMGGMSGGGGGGAMGGMSSATPPPPPPTTSLAADGEGKGKCTCGDTGECRVCRLKAALSNSKKGDK